MREVLAQFRDLGNEVSEELNDPASAILDIDRKSLLSSAPVSWIPPSSVCRSQAP